MSEMRIIEFQMKIRKVTLLHKNWEVSVFELETNIETKEKDILNIYKRAEKCDVLFVKHISKKQKWTNNYIHPNP